MKRTQLITTADLTRGEVDFLLKEADELRKAVNTGDIAGRVVATLFLEPSTRTRLSFETAAHRLGGSVISVSDPSNTSIKKGETLPDTIRVVEKYADVIVMRHPKAGAAEEAIRYTKKPFINAGDGPNQHPTQSLLDMYTINREMGKIDGLTVAFVGDLKFGRTVHSLTYLLSLYDVKILFIAPDSLQMPDEYLKLLDKKGIKYIKDSDLNRHMPEIDVLYMTRVQQERFTDEKEYLALKGSYILTPKIVKMGKPGMRILHPLPRVDEITSEVDDMPQAAYFRQVENGVYMRMAIIKSLVSNYYN